MIPYVGGKSYLASWIISRFPEDFREMTYCEVFGGGGWVLYKKDPSYIEIYNDLNSHLVNLFKVIRNDFKKFNHKAEWSLHSREMYMEARKRLKDDKTLNRIEKAMHYAIEQVQSFSGNGGWGYAVSTEKIVSGKWQPFLRRLELINARLKRVQIECLDFEKLIKKYDTKNTLFYLDPPYINKEYYYNTDGVNFKLNDHERLVKILRKIKGKFILSYYDDPLARKLYDGFIILKKESVKHSQGITRNTKLKKKQKATELLIMNY